jgi:macrolide transport system ATP-binding/permease protein
MMRPRRWSWWLRRRRKEDELREELEFHLEAEADRLQADGVPEPAARRAARRDLGNITLVREETRALWTWTGIELLGKDVRYALRNMASNRAFTALTVACLALGIGGTATIFSFMDAILFRSLPVDDPRSLVVLSWRMAAAPSPDAPSPVRLLRGILTEDAGAVLGRVWPYPAFELFQAETGVFAGVFGQQVVNGLLVDGGEGGLADGTYVTGSYFESLGVRPIAGRILTGDDDRVGAPPVVVVTAAFASERFGSTAAAVGRSLRLDNLAFTVVGVSPPEFFGLDPARSPDVFMPVRTGPLLQAGGTPGSTPEMYRDPGDYWLAVVGRLRPGTDPERAQAVLRHRFEQFLAGSGATAEQLRRSPTLAVEEGAGGLDGLRRRYRDPLAVLFVMVLLMLAIACANVASLLTSRAVSRRREIAVRLSVGAGRVAVIRQLLTESVLLALLGGAAGIALSLWGMPLLTALLANGQDGFTLRAGLNWQVLAFTVCVSMITGLVFGLAPAVYATRFSIFPALKGMRSTDSGGLTRRRLRPGLGQVLVVTQIALSLVLLVGAGLFARTVSNLRSTELGFNRDGLLLATTAAARAGYSDDALKQFYRELMMRVRRIPGVEDATMSWSVLAGGGTYVRPVSVPGTDLRRSEINIQVIGESFFRTMQIPILAGRAIGDEDVAARRAVAVVDQRFAETYFAGRDPVGRTIQVEGEGALEVVGVSANARHDVVRGDVRPVVYFTYAWDPHPLYQMVFELRTRGEPMAYAEPFRQVVRAMNPAVTVTAPRTQSANLDRTINQEIVFARLSHAFALVALSISCIGLYGTVSYGMARRTEEIGIRMALGASRASVLRLAFGQVLSLGVAGLALGVPASLAASGFVERFLWGVAPGDPATMAAMVATSLVAMGLAGYVPARRAARIDPLSALKAE